MNKKSLHTRLKAATIHFGFSLVIFSVFVWVLLKMWYPEPYFTASGGWQGLKLVAMVDVVLGPLIMFAIFNPAKGTSKLLFDIGFIITLQISALVWGMMQVYEQRPVAAAFWEDTFYVVTATELNESELQSLSAFGEKLPVMVYVPKAILPTGIEAELQRMQRTRTPPYAFTEKYQPYRDHITTIRDHQLEMNEILSANNEMNDAYQKLLQKYPTYNSHFLAPLISKYHNTLIMFTHNGDILGYLDAPYKPVHHQ